MRVRGLLGAAVSKYNDTEGVVMNFEKDAVKHLDVKRGH